MLDELKRNGSGYYDPTAYKAMKNSENGGVSNMNIRKGEIWEVEHGKFNKLALVLAYKGGYCSVLLLNDNQREQSDIQLVARGMKYAESGMVTCKFTDAFVDFVRTSTDEEFEDVRAKVAKSLDLSVAVSDEDYFEKLLADKNEEIEALKDRIKVLVEQNAEVHHSITERTVIELTVERDLYKTQYEKLLERLIGA